MNLKLKLEELNRLSTDAYQNIEKQEMVVILDNVRSMHNVGSVFRTADAFRIAKLYLCGYTPKPPHREIHKTAIGAEESVAWEAHDDTLTLVQSLQQQGYRILSVEQTQQTTLLHDYKPESNQKLAVILGNEVEGVSQSVINISDTVIEIPQFGTKHSLNVSVAAGIVLYALSRFDF